MSVCAKEDYEIVDDKAQNVYNIKEVKAVLIDKITHTYNWRDLSVIAKRLFGYENQIVRFWDDDGLGLAYPKDNDKVQEHLAKMAIENIREKGN
jgi:hypothetical protein